MPVFSPDASAAGRQGIEELVRAGHPRGLLFLDPVSLNLDDLVSAWSRALRDMGPAGEYGGPSVYVHFPFCPQSCSFCQYWHTVPRRYDEMVHYVRYLTATIDRYAAKLGRIDIANVYFGGGTPTALTSTLWEEFFASFGHAFRVRGEFCCEGHPGTLNETKLNLLKRAGVTRMSMGVQSFDQEVLAAVNRLNRPLTRLEFLSRAVMDRGIALNLDLILGLPEQTAESARRDLETLLAIGPDEITLYRYQPTERLPMGPVHGLSLPSFLSTRVRAGALRRGYIPAPMMPTQKDSSVVLVKLSNRNAMKLRETIAARERALKRSQSPAPVYYPPYDVPDRFVLGFGISSISHLPGFAWYVDTSRLDRVGPDTAPRYRGTRVSGAEEAKRRYLAHGTRRTRLRERGRIGAALEFVQQRVEHADALRKGDDPRREGETEAAARERLVTETMSRWTGAPFTERDEPPPVEQSVAEPPIDQAAQRGLDATAAWRDRVARRFDHVDLESDSNAELRYRVHPAPQPALILMVRWRGSGAFFRQSERFEFSYLLRPERDITPEEIAFIDACAKAADDSRG